MGETLNKEVTGPLQKSSYAFCSDLMTSALHTSTDFLTLLQMTFHGIVGRRHCFSPTRRLNYTIIEKQHPSVSMFCMSLVPPPRRLVWVMQSLALFAICIIQAGESTEWAERECAALPSGANICSAEWILRRVARSEQCKFIICWFLIALSEGFAWFDLGADSFSFSAQLNWFLFGFGPFINQTHTERWKKALEKFDSSEKFYFPMLWGLARKVRRLIGGAP